MKMRSIIKNMWKYPYYRFTINDMEKDIFSVCTHPSIDVVAFATKQMLELVVVITRPENHFVRR